MLIEYQGTPLLYAAIHNGLDSMTRLEDGLDNGSWARAVLAHVDKSRVEP
jgi:hypothetical protein